MVGVIGAISSVQNSVLRSGLQSASAPEPAPPPPLSSIDFIVSGIYMDNLQNVAILEYRSAKTGEVIQQYPDQAQINAFKAAQRLAQQAADAKQQSSQAADSYRAAVQAANVRQTDTTSHTSSPTITSSAGNAKGMTTSVIA